MNSISIHDTNRSPIARTHQETRVGRSQIKQTSLFSGDKAYLYGDTTYTGTLIHPIERTYPPKWSVKLDRGGYEAVNIKHITVTEPSQHSHLPEPTTNEYQPDLENPFRDLPQTRSKHGWGMGCAVTPKRSGIYIGVEAQRERF